MSDETPDTTGLREAVEALADDYADRAARVPGDIHAPYRHAAADLRALLAAHPTPDASPDPAVVTPGGNPVCPKCGRWYGPGIACACDSAVVTPDVETLAARLYLADRRVVAARDSWEMLADHRRAPYRGMAYAARDHLANHVAAAREADRAEVERYRNESIEMEEAWERATERAVLAERRLAGLVTKVEALADNGMTDAGDCCSDYCVADVHDLRLDQAERLEELLRTLIPADAATALDAVREKAKAEERERIAQAIEAAAIDADGDMIEVHGAFVRRAPFAAEHLRDAARIARHTPEDGA